MQQPTDVPPVSVPEPWWQVGHVWLVIAGPALVVVASLVTVYLALTRPDPVVPRDPPATGVVTGSALQPAQQARNHVATAGVTPP